MKATKITVVGTGFVGSAIAFALMTKELASDIVLVDVNKDKAFGEALDLSHGEAFVAPVRIRSGDYELSAGSDIVIITAGLAQKPGETRLDLVRKNTEIFKSMIPQIVRYNPDAILLVVANPVDILTYVTRKLSGFPENRVFGSGTVLDSGRFRSILAQSLEVSIANVHAMIVGEHGDSEIALWSLVRIQSMELNAFTKQIMNTEWTDAFKEEIASSVRDSAYQIINRKGYTNYGVALAVSRIVQSVVRDEQSILTVSSYLDGAYGIHDLYLSTPTLVGRSGTGMIIEAHLSDDELRQLQKSADLMHQVLEPLDL